jgi:hypothetical protein
VRSEEEIISRLEALEERVDEAETAGREVPESIGAVVFILRWVLGEED